MKKMLVLLFLFAGKSDFQYLFITLYYRQLSADIKMLNNKIKTSFFRYKWLEAHANKTVIEMMIFSLIFVRGVYSPWDSLLKGGGIKEI